VLCFIDFCIQKSLLLRNFSFSQKTAVFRKPSARFPLLWFFQTPSDAWKVNSVKRLCSRNFFLTDH